ncbi:hypothetical protein [Maricaulis sp.]|uniref:hypothetical protein n=1 Tax=Maricaulis sp. TaxID=1486257 RepID=UPI0026153BDB|nr:hypothetical protein [Maricaulis sp.]
MLVPPNSKRPTYPQTTPANKSPANPGRFNDGPVSLGLVVTKQMVDQVEARHAQVPERLSGDTAYSSADMLSRIADTKITQLNDLPPWTYAQRR